MSRKWNSNTVITKEQLMNEYNVINVTPYGWITKNGKMHEPTVSPQYRKDKKVVSYVVCQACLYGGNINGEKNNPKYLRVPFSKMVYAWYYGQTSVDKVIDHINQNTLDCRPENLREVDEFWNLSKNTRVWNWPQTELWKAKVRKEKGVTYKQLVKALGEWIQEAQEFYERCSLTDELENNLF